MSQAWHDDAYFDDGQGFGKAPESEPTALVLAAEGEAPAPPAPPAADGGVVYNADDFTQQQLRDAAKAAGLTQRGSKEELADRLNAA